MKKIKDIEDELYQKFCNGEKLSIGKIQQFYRQAITELVEEIIGEDYKHTDNLTHEKDEYWCCPDCLQDGFKNQAKAESRDRAKQLME